MLLRMMRGGQAGGAPLALGLILLFGVLSVLRPVNHDESQYVAAAILARTSFRSDSVGLRENVAR